MSHRIAATFAVAVTVTPPAVAVAEADSDPLNSTLRNTITPCRAPLLADRVHVVGVPWAYESMPGGDGWRMSWAPVAEIPLCSACPPLPDTT
ncbi:hypothetical protein [Streptomyces sp. NPDC018352]|uniref:hypothetical protein n=1 Tax=Streptomyces sp. NPDC018352 TaxID=3157194 RepID=UPI0033DF5530